MIDQYVAFTYTETMLRNAPRRRSCRSFVRNQGWWDTVVNNYSDERFKYTFRMSRNTFNYILENIRGGLQKQIVTELTICPEMRLAICLYKLARGDYYYTIGKMAGTAQSTICRIAIKVSELITEMMWESILKIFFLNTLEEFKTAMVDMESEWQFPFAFLGIDRSYLPTLCPKAGSEAIKQYYNFKNFYSIILLTLTDAR